MPSAPLSPSLPIIFLILYILDIWKITKLKKEFDWKLLNAGWEASPLYLSNFSYLKNNRKTWLFKVWIINRIIKEDLFCFKTPFSQSYLDIENGYVWWVTQKYQRQNLFRQYLNLKKYIYIFNYGRLNQYLLW